MNKKEKIILILKSIPFFLTVICATIGIVLFILRLLNPDYDTSLFYFIIITMFAHFLAFLTLFTASFIFGEYYNDLIRKALSLLINVPFTILYIALVLTFNN